MDAALAGYRHNPHIADRALHDRLVGVLHATVRAVADQGLRLKVLEVGAGHGGYTESLLAAGCDVTTVEMSRPSYELLRARYGLNPRLTPIFDPTLGLTDAGDGHSLVVCVSLLHHIPDYIGFLGRLTDRISHHGTLLAFEEPLWYPRVGTLTRSFDRSAYLVWRIRQGRVREGLASMRRRLRGIPLDADPGKIVYYHVVRRGVDEAAVRSFLAQRFERVETFRYWSNHLAAARHPAELMGLMNKFGVRAAGSI